MPAQNQADKLVFTFILDFIEFVHKFYEESIEVFNVYKVSGITSTPQMQDMTVESLLFLSELLQRCREPHRRGIILSHLLEGRLRVEKLKILSTRLGGRGRRNGQAVSPDLIAVYGYKVYGFTNQQIADYLHLSVKRVKGLVSEIYRPFISDENVNDQRKLLLLQKSALDEGFIPSRR